MAERLGERESKSRSKSRKRPVAAGSAASEGEIQARLLLGMETLLRRTESMDARFVALETSQQALREDTRHALEGVEEKIEALGMLVLGLESASVGASTAASAASEPQREPPSRSARPPQAPSTSMYVDDTIIVGGFEARTPGGDIKSKLDEILDALPQFRKNQVRFAYPGGLVDSKGFFRTNELSTSALWDLIEAMRVGNHKSKGGNLLWISRAKTGAALAQGAKLRGAKEVVASSGKLPPNLGVEVDARRRRVITLPAGTTVAQLDGQGELVVNWGLLQEWGYRRESFESDLAMARTERQFL